MLPTEPAPQPPPAAAPPPAGNRPGLLGTIVETARETGRAVLREEAVGPLLEVLLAKLCSAPVRQAIEQHAAEALHAALQASVEVLPEAARGGALDAQLARAEDTARRLLADSLAEAFSPAARAELQQELERAMQAALDTDADAARTYTERAAHAVLLHVLVVFHRHWAQLLRVLLPLFVT